jgi:hypothetical protein
MKPGVFFGIALTLIVVLHVVGAILLVTSAFTALSLNLTMVYVMGGVVVVIGIFVVAHMLVFTHRTKSVPGRNEDPP